MRIETTAGSMLGLLLLLCVGTLPLQILAWNSTYGNPILPGFHPDPSCVFVQELDNTFFCASSSFSVFPGIPIHASKDLVNWKLISNALSRPEQLPTLAVTNKSTSGIWASTIRYQEGTFYLLTTLVFDDQPESNFSRWDNMIFTSSDPYTSASWSQPVHFNFTGYDTSPFWDADGTVYVTGSHPWEVTHANDPQPDDRRGRRLFTLCLERHGRTSSRGPTHILARWVLLPHDRRGWHRPESHGDDCALACCGRAL